MHANHMCKSQHNTGLQINQRNLSEVSQAGNELSEAGPKTLKHKSSKRKQQPSLRMWSVLDLSFFKRQVLFLIYLVGEIIKILNRWGDSDRHRTAWTYEARSAVSATIRGSHFGSGRFGSDFSVRGHFGTRSFRMSFWVRLEWLESLEYWLVCRPAATAVSFPGWKMRWRCKQSACYRRVQLRSSALFTFPHVRSWPSKSGLRCRHFRRKLFGIIMRLILYSVLNSTGNTVICAR